MKKPAKLFFFVLLPALLLAGGLYYGVRVYKHKDVSADKSGSSKDPDRTYRVTRGDMTLGLRLNGTIVANKKHKLGLEANFATQILSVVDENTSVKEGDVLIEFEDSDLIERIEEMRTTLSNTEEELVIAIENEKIQERKNEVTLREAEDRVRSTESDLRKYLRLTRSQKRDSNDLAIANAEANLANAKKNYSDKKYDITHSGVTDDAARKANENELKNLQSKIESSENSLNQAEIEGKSFKHYDDPIKLMSLNNSVAQARLNLEQARISTPDSLNPTTLPVVTIVIWLPNLPSLSRSNLAISFSHAVLTAGGTTIRILVLRPSCSGILRNFLASIKATVVLPRPTTSAKINPLWACMIA